MTDLERLQKIGQKALALGNQKVVEEVDLLLQQQGQSLSPSLPLQEARTESPVIKRQASVEEDANDFLQGLIRGVGGASFLPKRDYGFTGIAGELVGMTATGGAARLGAAKLIGKALSPISRAVALGATEGGVSSALASDWRNPETAVMNTLLGGGLGAGAERLFARLRHLPSKATLQAQRDLEYLDVALPKGGGADIPSEAIMNEPEIVASNLPPKYKPIKETIQTEIAERTANKLDLVSKESAKRAAITAENLGAKYAKPKLTSKITQTRNAAFIRAHQDALKRGLGDPNMSNVELREGLETLDKIVKGRATKMSALRKKQLLKSAGKAYEQGFRIEGNNKIVFPSGQELLFEELLP